MIVELSSRTCTTSQRLVWLFRSGAANGCVVCILRVCAVMEGIVEDVDAGVRVTVKESVEDIDVSVDESVTSVLIDGVVDVSVTVVIVCSSLTKLQK